VARGNTPEVVFKGGRCEVGPHWPKKGTAAGAGERRASTKKGRPSDVCQGGRSEEYKGEPWMVQKVNQFNLPG